MLHRTKITVEWINGKLYGVCTASVDDDWTDSDTEQFKDYLIGQYADGWGEGFEQREIDTSDGELYVHLWSWENWSIQTEEERFGPKLAEGLPEMCFSVLRGTGQLICIKRGESGYYPSDWDTGDRQENEELANYNNERLGVTQAQRQAMEAGSMFGWATPAADPANYDEQGKLIKPRHIDRGDAR